MTGDNALEFQSAGGDMLKPKAREVLDKAAARWGHVPNLLAAMATSAPTVTTYWECLMPLQLEALDRIEQLLVEITVSVANRCDYCVAAHTMGARAEKMPSEMLAALRERQPIVGDPKRQILRTFAESVVERRGWIRDEDRLAMRSVGYAEAAMMEVVMLVSIKTLTNYAHHVGQVPLDESMQRDGVKWVDEMPQE